MRPSCREGRKAAEREEESMKIANGKVDHAAQKAYDLLNSGKRRA
jgi:hypothetical protein